MTDQSGKKPILLVALGGNALIRKGQEGTIEQQFENLKLPVRQIARLSRKYRIIITHGNGPQVGNLLLQQECCDAVPKLPLEILGAQTEGQIGYMIESTLDGELMTLGIYSKPLVTLITYVVVDKNDAAFDHPTKPIGPVYTKAQAVKLDCPVMETSKGYRRVVASPLPLTIIEKNEIEKLIEMDFIVICCGGGGIPVIRKGRAFSGVNAVIDKDLASALLATETGVDIFVMATDVEGVMLNFGKKEQTLCRSLSVEEAGRYLRQKQFAAGSMSPKVTAAMQFVKNTGKKTVICSINDLETAVTGNAGTKFEVNSEDSKMSAK